MANLAALIKNLVVYLLPFYLIHLYLKQFYGVGGKTIIQWWMKNWGGLEHPGISVTFTLLAILFATMVTSGVINSAYLAAFGENHTLVYLGNSSESRGHYVTLDDSHEDVLTSSTDNNFATSFEPIYRTEVFRKDRGHQSVGVPLKAYRFGNLISHVLALLAVWLFLIGMLHIFAHPVSVAELGGAGKVEMASMENLAAYLQGLNLSVGKVMALFFGALLLGVISSYWGAGAARGERAFPLPSHVSVGNTLMATPVDIHVEKERRRRSSDDEDYELVDNGFRYVTFKFTEGFSTPVYVALRYHKDDYPKWYDVLTSRIKNQRPMTVRVERGLTLSLTGS